MRTSQPINIQSTYDQSSHSIIQSVSTHLFSSCSVSFPIYLVTYLSTCPTYLFPPYPSLPLTILTFFLKTKWKMIKTIKMIKHFWVGGGQQAISSVMLSLSCLDEKLLSAGFPPVVCYAVRNAVPLKNHVVRRITSCLSRCSLFSICPTNGL